MQSVLVTGAGGYIGTTLVPMLIQKGYAVTALDRFFFGESALANHENLTLIREDVRRLTPAHLKGIDCVIDLAAMSNDPSGELFQNATFEINFEARARCARLAKEAGASRYVLPSSCSIYGHQPSHFIADETSSTNPLTIYAKANERAEKAVLPLADDRFCVTVVRQATVYGYSPRMRFDLAINGMTLGAWKSGKLPVMRDGTQWRPMVHVKDTSTALTSMLTAPRESVNGQIFNVGSLENTYQIGPLAALVAANVGRPVAVEWYGDPDHRSYRVAFDKIEGLGFKARYSAQDGVREVVSALASGKCGDLSRSITLNWYKELVKWHKIIREVELHNGIIDIS